MSSLDYSCAWQKEILIQGRMYISGNYLCFHANFLKWETRLTLHFRDIVLITREKTAKVIPNAIEFKNNKNEKYFFASFATRDKTFATISKIWKTISIDRVRRKIFRKIFIEFVLLAFIFGRYLEYYSTELWRTFRSHY